MALDPLDCYPICGGFAVGFGTNPGITVTFLTQERKEKIALEDKREADRKVAVKEQAQNVEKEKREFSKHLQKLKDEQRQLVTEPLQQAFDVCDIWRNSLEHHPWR